MDEKGYVGEFLAEYGTYEDYENYLASVACSMRDGRTMHIIPFHSHITEFWLWFGICGLIFCLYMIFVLIRYLRQDCWAVPQWYMWTVASTPAFFWAIFFSPFTERVSEIIFILACLMARAVRTGAQPMPDYMQEEILKVEAK